ncbi:MAG: transposase [Pirellulales bacterium]|nr:transposase [Pirellulales bacterium]
MFELFDPQGEFHVRAGSSLPHWHQPGISYFVTFRTADSIPEDVNRRWHAQRFDWLRRHGISLLDAEGKNRFSQLPEAARRQFHDTFSREHLEALDKGHGACMLRRPELRKIVVDSLRHFDGDRYHLGDFVVMPNHVHVIVCLIGDTEIESQCSSWKRFSARKINQTLGATGRFWQEESFDHLIRSPEQFESIQQYIRNNPLHFPKEDYSLYNIQ